MSDSEETEMSDAEREVQFSLKVLINKQKTKVLFAEVDSDFADVLLSFLTLPLGTVVRVLEEHYVARVKIGSISSLYNGLSNLDSANFCTEGSKNMLLNPRSSFEYECRRLKLDISETHLNKYYFSCENPSCVHPRHSNISMHRDIARCLCGKSLNREVVVRNWSKVGDDDDDYCGGVLTLEKQSFLISDDLVMVPNMAGSAMETLTNLGITDMDGAELRIVTFGFNEIIGLLKGSLLSRTPLSDIILLYRRKFYVSRPKLDPINSIHGMEKEANNSNSNKKMIVKVMVQKSTNKLLFAQAQEDFVDFLCSFLTVPLGGIEHLLGNNTCFKSIDNLYRSLARGYIANADIKKRLMNPMLPRGYICRYDHIFPLSGETASQLFYHKGLGKGEGWLSYSFRDTKAPETIKCRNNDGSYVRWPKMYMVRDDLTVTPLCMISIFSILNEMKIPLSDVKEVEVHIGLQEGLSILKASLTSSSALSDGLLMNPMLNIQPKQER